MRDPRVIVVGAGPAGMAAAVALARAGIGVLVVDHAAAPGGAVHCAPLDDGRKIGLREHRQTWSALMAEVRALGAAIEVQCGTAFGGVDAAGGVLLTGAVSRLLHPRGVVVAVGARERVLPRPGWTLPGVTTVGAIQTGLKRLGEAPKGRLLLAGSGPLLLALGAELAAAGTPPVAVVEAARPPVAAALGLPLAYLAEGLGYRLRLARAGVPVLTGSTVRAVAPGLRVSVDTPRGPRRFDVDHLGLHDGIRPNDSGLGGPVPIPVLRAGDCREALGARAAVLDGRRAGQAIAAILRGEAEPGEGPALLRQRAAQALLARIYRHEERLDALPPETTICRCENRTLADLAALGPEATARDLRLVGRFGMGACQGRFCAEWVAHFTRAPDLGRPRSPVRPLAIADLLAIPIADQGVEE